MATILSRLQCANSANMSCTQANGFKTTSPFRNNLFMLAYSRGVSRQNGEPVFISCSFIFILTVMSYRWTPSTDTEVINHCSRWLHPRLCKLFPPSPFQKPHGVRSTKDLKRDVPLILDINKITGFRNHDANRFPCFKKDSYPQLLLFTGHNKIN